MMNFRGTLRRLQGSEEATSRGVQGATKESRSCKHGVMLVRLQEILARNYQAN
jgi:hypothetical protein